MLQAHAQVFNACNCFKMSPPPAISASLAVATRDELNRCGRIATQVGLLIVVHLIAHFYCVQEFNSCFYLKSFVGQ